MWSSALHDVEVITAICTFLLPIMCVCVCVSVCVCVCVVCVCVCVCVLCVCCVCMCVVCVCVCVLCVCVCVLCVSYTYHTNIIALEVGSRGFLCMEGFQQLYRLLHAKAKDRQSFELDMIRHVVTCSCNIWCKRNWS